MKVDQLSIFLENRAGRLAEVTRILADSGVNIRALSLADTSDFGILRLIVSDFEKAKENLKAGGFTVGRTTVVAVEVTDKPGGLNSILEMLRDAKINVEYMYAFVEKRSDKALVVFRFDDSEKALRLLAAHHINVVCQADLAGL